MAAKKSNPAADNSDREIVISRVINAPREMVWNAFTDPEQVAKWWGPNGFTTTIEVMDVRVGGKWKHVMRGPDGREYPNQSTFKEIVRPERIRFAHEGNSEGKPEVSFDATWTFEDQGDKTLITGRMVFPTQQARDTVAKEYGAIEGAKQHVQNLEDYLNQPVTGKPFVISRVFDAPRELMWKVWTERERFMKWYGPKGVTMRAATFDFRPGGICHYCMVTPDGKEMWGKAIYREITPPEKIVWISTFSDKDGGLTRHPFAPGWPRQMLTTATFDPEGEKTRVTIHWLLIDPSDEERKIFDENHSNMNKGWTGTFEQLTDYLAGQRV